MRSYHVVNATKYSVAPGPVAQNAGVVLRFVSSQILLAGETPASSLGAFRVTAEEVLAVPLVVLAKVAPSSKDGSGCASGISAGPCPVLVREAVGSKVW